MTAIANLSVADVRKALLTLRTACENSCADLSINPSQTLVETLTMSEFAFLFVSSHHTRRKAPLRDAVASDAATHRNILA